MPQKAPFIRSSRPQAPWSAVPMRAPQGEPLRAKALILHLIEPRTGLVAVLRCKRLKCFLECDAHRSQGEAEHAWIEVHCRYAILPLFSWNCPNHKGLARRRKSIQLVGIEACPLSEWLYGALVDSGFTTVCSETRHAQRAPAQKNELANRAGPFRAAGSLELCGQTLGGRTR
jgi:hypothetical protein